MKALTGGSVKVAYQRTLLLGGRWIEIQQDNGCGACRVGGWLWRMAGTGLLVGICAGLTFSLSCPLSGDLGPLGRGLLLDGGAV
ncbi:hypothetical protein NDU88_004417 [Pleurodeles waltl]|uniref:Uncharacterized protein n=1 Tax=Pleurodeles waltl TaxID=8319 RepID=A0AAV7VIU2_PLEWA|nr:hypothetical protein NDU88_004417 [Pleurodeles waltl]